MNSELKELIISIYDEKIKKLQKAKEEFLKENVYRLITPTDIFSEFCRQNPHIPAGELVNEYKNRYGK